MTKQAALLSIPERVRAREKRRCDRTPKPIAKPALARKEGMASQTRRDRLQREHSAQGYGDAEPDVACAGGREDINKHTCQDGDGAPIEPAAVRAEPQQGHGERGRERSELEALWPCVRAETGQARKMPRARASRRRKPPHRRLQGYDIRSREGRGRSRARRGDETSEGQPNLGSGMCKP